MRNILHPSVTSSTLSLNIRLRTVPNKYKSAQLQYISLFGTNTASTSIICKVVCCSHLEVPSKKHATVT
jgi:hypothetical protein